MNRLQLGYQNGAGGTAMVDGVGSQITASAIDSGTYGRGEIYLTNGGTVTTTGTIVIGSASSANGLINVGAGSTLNCGGYLQISSFGGLGTLAGTGTITVNNALVGLDVYGRGMLSPGDTPGAIGKLNITTGKLNLRDDATIAFDYNNSGSVAGINHDTVALTGSATLGSTLNIALPSLSPGSITGGPRTILSTTGGITGTPTGTLSAVVNGSTLNLSTSSRINASVALAVSGNNLNITALNIDPWTNKALTWTGTAGTTWDLASNNWSDGFATQFLDGDAVTFNTSANTVITVDGTQKVVADMVVNNTGNLTINGNIVADASQSALLTGGSALAKSGTGTLTLTGTNDFKGGAIVTGGLVNFKSADNFGSGYIFLNGGGLQWATGTTTDISPKLDAIGSGGGTFNTNGNNVTLGAALAGAGGITKAGAGVLTLTGANNYGGSTTVSQGTLTGNIASGTDLAVASGATYNAGGANRTVGALTGAGSAAMGGNSLTVNSGAFSGIISGTGAALTKTSAGMLTLSDNNTYTGGTTVNNGLINFNATNNFGTGGITLNGGGLQWASGTTTDISSKLTAIGASGGTFDTNGNDVSFATALSGGALTKTGTGTLTLQTLGSYAGAVAINQGTLKVKAVPTFNNALTGTGVLAVEQAGAGDAFAFGTGAGNAFAGTVGMLRGTISLDDANTYAVLQNAALRLDADASTTVTQNRTIKGLELNGGTLKFDVAAIAPKGVLSVTDLDTSGGTIQMDLNTPIDTTAASMGNWYDYGDSAAAKQIKIVGATNVTGGLLAWKDYQGNALGAGQTRDIDDASGKIGTATFDYAGSVVSSGADQGIFLGYTLTQLAADSGKTLVLDSTGASGTTLNAKLTGAGGFTFSGAKDVSVGNAGSDYAGATSVTDAHTVTMLTNNAFGNTSGLTLLNNGKIDMAGMSQTVGTLNGAAGTGIVLGSLTVSDGGAFAGLLSGSGSLVKTGTGILSLSGNNSYGGGTTVTGGLINFTNTGLGTGNISLNGGGLQWAGGNTADVSARLTALGANGATFDTNSNDVTFANALTGSGALTKTGAGALTLAASTTLGGFDVQAGELAATGALTATQSVAVSNGATLTVGALTTPVLTLSGAGAKANITTLDVSGGDSVITGTGTTAANFAIATANLSGGRLLSIDNSAGEMTLTDLNIAAGQSGRLFVADGTRQSITNLNAAGADLTFVLPANVVANQTIVSVDTANLNGATLGVNDGNGRVNMTAGQSVKLIAAATSLSATGVNLTVQTANGDIFDVQVNSNDITLILQQISPNTPAYERLKAYAEGRAATLSFVNQGADLILGQGMGSALVATSGPGWKMNAFGATSGGWSRYNTGSHVDVSGASMLAGLAVGNDAGPGRLTAGLFFEGGWGSYNSYNSFSNYASAKGDGNTSYYGGGILGRWEFPLGRTGSAAAAQRSEPGTALPGEARASAAQEARSSVIYIDASARMGRASTDFSTGDIRYNGNKADFDSSSMYFGAHTGLGYLWSFTEKAMLDLSGKFIWTRQNGDNVDVQGDRVRFKDADSLRTRLGGRFNYAANEYVAPYTGAYWEHEFDGRQRSSVNGVGIDSPSLKGDTGVGELGLTIKPVKDSGFSMDFGVQGYTGVREGVTGSVQLKFEF